MGLVLWDRKSLPAVTGGTWPYFFNERKEMAIIHY